MISYSNISMLKHPHLEPQQAAKWLNP